MLDESRMLCARGLQLALAPYPRIWPIGGGSDIELVTAMLMDVALCLPCLSGKAGISVETSTLRGGRRQGGTVPPYSWRNPFAYDGLAQGKRHTDAAPLQRGWS